MKNFSFYSLRVRLIFLFLLTVIPALGLTFYEASEERRREIAKAQDNAIRLAGIIAIQEDQLLNTTRQLLIALSHLSRVTDGEAPACSELFADLREKHYSRYANIGAAKLNGDVFCSALPLTRPVNIADRKYFKNATKTRGFSIGDYQIGRITGKTAINFGYPVIDEAGNIKGVIFAAMDMKWFNFFEFDVESQLPKHSTLTKIDSNGIVLAHYDDHEELIGKPLPMKSLWETIKTRQEGVVETKDSNGNPRIYAFKPLASPMFYGKLYVILGIPTEVAFADVNRILTRNLFLVGLVALLVFAAVWLGSVRLILRPVNALVNVAQRLSKGDLSARSGFSYSQGELGQLSHTFDKMAETLQSREEERKRADETLQRSEEQARRLARENAILAEIGRVISSTLDIEEVYDRFAQEVKKLIPFDRIGISTVDLEHQRLTIAYVSGHDIPDRRQGDHFPLAGSVAEELIKRRSSIILQTDKEEEWAERFPALVSSFQSGIRSILAAPLFSKDHVIGVLHLQSLTPKAYTEADLQVAERVGNQIAGAIANAQLFAQHERSEAEKASLQAQLLQSQKMEAIGQLAGGVAHDFNNLLTVISIQSQLSLLGLREGDPLKEKLKDIEQAADRAANLTRQLLAFSRRQILEIKVVNLNFIVNDLGKMLHRVIGEDIELKTLLADDLGMVKVDPGQMEQVIVNLAVNARDAMPQGGKLAIETTNVELDEEYANMHMGVMPGSYVLLLVSDTGIGISKEVKERIFDPFFTTKEKGKGTGLGLATVYGIVKQTGGDIYVYSEVGKGTTFKIYFPRVFEPGEELAKKESGKEVPRGNETILVVEDDSMVRKLAVNILRGQGYTVLEAEAGEEALLVCDQYKDPIHLILTDVVMPKMSGAQFIERLRQVREDFKVLYMTGYAENAVTQHGILEEGLNVIPKPFTFEKLAKKVREVLDKN